MKRSGRAWIWIVLGGIFLIIILIYLIFSLNHHTSRGKGSPTSIEGPSPRPPKNQFVFRLAEALPADYPATIGDLEFARLVGERSQGRIKIIVVYGAKLGEEQSVIEQVRLGGIDFARVNAAPLSETDPTLRVLSMPYMFRDAGHLWKVLYGPIGDEILAGLSSYNLVGLTYYSSAARNFYLKKPIHHVADMKGLRIRIQQSKLYVDLVKALGAEPVQIPFGDVYNALVMGEVDGAENNWSSYIAVKHYRLARYFIVDTHTRTPEVLFANRRIFNQLSVADQRLILKAARDSVQKEWESSFNMEHSSEQIARKSGVTVIELNSTEREDFKKAVAPLYDVYSRDYQKLIERIRSTR